MKPYRVYAGEGENGSLVGYARSLRGARRMATIARCGGDRWARIEENMEGNKNSMGERMTGWMPIE